MIIHIFFYGGQNSTEKGDGILQQGDIMYLHIPFCVI